MALLHHLTNLLALLVHLPVNLLLYHYLSYDHRFPNKLYYHNKITLSWYHHQPESHQQNFEELSLRGEFIERLGFIDRTPGTPGSGKKVYIIH